MKDWKEILISPSTPILQAIKIIDASALQIALVVDESRRLLGTVTDGDIRRGILKGNLLEESVEKIMNIQPTTAKINDGKQDILIMMKAKGIQHIPIVNDTGKIIGMETLENLTQPQVKDNIVVIMAGGLGNRLRPLTDNCPKPLLRVGCKPILETIIQNFIEHGFRNFYLAVNYKAEMIKDYFGDGSRWGVKFSYLHEEKRMGTVGALSLLPGKIEQPILVMNGDLLTKVNFRQLLEFHLEHQAEATMCVREYTYQVPYGVVKVEKDCITSIEEKPVQNFFVSGGIYVLNPEILPIIPKGSFFDMPSLFELLIRERYKTTAFPIREYWIDIGRIDDFERANGDFQEVFG